MGACDKCLGHEEGWGLEVKNLARSRLIVLDRASPAETPADGIHAMPSRIVSRSET